MSRASITVLQPLFSCRPLMYVKQVEGINEWRFWRVLLLIWEEEIGVLQ
jgi:hypothetical protein